MKITITIPDKDVKQAIQNRLENDIYEQYDTDVLKKAKVPGKASIIKQLLETPAFITALEKRIIEYGDFEDALYECIYDVDSPIINGLEEKCSRAYSEINEELDARRKDLADAARAAEDEKAVLRLVSALEKAGYKIIKA